MKTQLADRGGNHLEVPLSSSSRQSPFLSSEAVAGILAIVWIATVMLGSVTAIVVSSFIGTALCIGWMWSFVGDRRRFTSLLTLGATSLMLILNAGILVAWASCVFGLKRQFTDPFQAIGVSPREYATAVLYGILFSGVLAGIARFWVVRALEALLAKRLTNTLSVKTSTVIIFLCFCLVVDFFALGTGVIKFRSVMTEGADEGRVAAFLPFMKAVFGVQICFNSLILSRFSRKQWNLLPLCLVMVSIGTVLLIYFSSGRSGFVMALALHLIFWSFFRGGKPSLKVLVLLGIGAGIVVPPLLVIANSMRGDSSGGGGRGGNVIETISEGYEKLEDEDTEEAENARTLVNLTSRPLVAKPLARSMALEGGEKNFLIGGMVVSSFVWVIPRAIFPEKVTYLAQEKLLYEALPDPIFLKDAADSVYLYAYADFGWFGILLYPLVLAALWTGTVRIMLLLRHPFFLWFAFATWPPMFLLSIGEGSLIGWFSTARNTLMFVFVLLIFDRFFGQAKKGLRRKNF